MLSESDSIGNRRDTNQAKQKKASTSHTPTLLAMADATKPKSSDNKAPNAVTAHSVQTPSKAVEPISKGLALAEKQIIKMSNGKHTETLVTTAAQREEALARPGPQKSEAEEVAYEYLISMNRGWDDSDDDDSSTIDWKAWTSLTGAEQVVYRKRIDDYTAWINKSLRQQQEEARRMMREARRPRELLIAKAQERAAKRLRWK